MAIPTVSKESVFKAMQYIDEQGVPLHNQSTKYDLIENDKKYPPKYVIAVADHIENGREINTTSFNAVEARMFLENLGLKVELKKYILTIEKTDSAEVKCISTDNRFALNELWRGDNYESVEAYFVSSNNIRIDRIRNKSEHKISNKTLPLIAFQLFEDKIDALSEDERLEFPICRYSDKDKLEKGIYQSADALKKARGSNSFTFMQYRRKVEGKSYFIHCFNTFSTILFVRECLLRFGEVGEKFILEYCDKDNEKGVSSTKGDEQIEESSDNTGEATYINKYSELLMKSYNVIFRGAPGTGKTFLAKQIAADIITKGRTAEYENLTSLEKSQMGFVQFHPNYDYSDFIEGLRPVVNNDGALGFELRDGVFKEFVSRARKNYEEHQKTPDEIKKETASQDAIKNFLSGIEYGDTKFSLKKGNEYSITNADDKYIYIHILESVLQKEIKLSISKLRLLLETNTSFSTVSEISSFFGQKNNTREDSYYYSILQELEKIKKSIENNNAGVSNTIEKTALKPYVFIIDEINRGEISKILGELFFSIDPGYRGKDGEIFTQYANMHDNPDEKFYIPENVYIIGTMNDIDRSVDSFDFAMRRRFRFIEIKANENTDMLNQLGDKAEEAKKRMISLNNAIIEIPDLNENYQIGASYYLKLTALSFDELWTDCLKPLLQDYVQGTNDEEDNMKKLEKAYYIVSNQENADEHEED